MRTVRFQTVLALLGLTGVVVSPIYAEEGPSSSAGRTSISARTASDEALERRLSILQQELNELQQQMDVIQKATQQPTQSTSASIRLDEPDDTELQPAPHCESNGDPDDAEEPCWNDRSFDPAFVGRCCSDSWLHEWDDYKWVKVGAGIRTSYNAVDEGAPNGSDTAHNFNLDNVRIYMSGQGHEYVGFELNTDINNAQLFEDVAEGPGGNALFGRFEDAGEIRILDAIVKLKLTDDVNFWFGRFLPPSDRSNLDGPFFLNAWSFPYVQFGFENIFQGRDDGAAFWGERMIAGRQLKWQVGLFEGEQNTPQGEDNLQFNARVVVNFLDPEPGYYNQSTYYGEKDILAVGASVFHQDNAHGIPGDTRDYTAWNVDFLYETKLENCGVVTLEAAYYDFDDNDAQAVDPTGRFTDLGRQGESWFILASYLIPRDVYIGKLEGRFSPYVRYLDYNHDFTPAAGGPFQFNEGLDLGLHYIMDGHDARVTAVWEQRNRAVGLSDINIFRLGAQVQF